MDIRKAADSVLIFAKSLAEDREGVMNILTLAWLKGVPDSWEGRVDPTEERVAKYLAEKKHSNFYINDACMNYPMNPPVHIVNNKNIVCISGIMGGAVPLWCHYVPMAREAIEVAKIAGVTPGVTPGGEG
jgi:hypothetical protein